MPARVNQPLPVVRVGEIASDGERPRWLVEGLWGHNSVGVIGGAPSARRPGWGWTWPLSVATGTACLGKYAVPEPGPVLVYLAEDALPVVRERIAGNGPASRSRSRRSRRPRDHRTGAPARSRSGPHAAPGDNPAAPAPAAAARSPGATSRHRREQRRRSGRAPGVLSLVAAAARRSRSCWCITRGRTPRGESPPVRDCAAPVTSTPSATRTSICGEPRTTWCSPASTARRRRRRRSIWNWSRPTRRRPTWRSSPSSRTASRRRSRGASARPSGPRAWC